MRSPVRYTNSNMTFHGEGGRWKAPKNEVLSDKEWDSEEEKRRLKDERDLAEVHIEYLGEEKEKMDNILALHEIHREHLESEKERLGKRIEDLGIDGLTGVQRSENFKEGLNRVFSMIRHQEKEQRKEGVHQKASLIFIDLDKFKLVNDNHGHLVGDEVLKSVASLLKKSLRGTDILARYGGDEFIALLPNTDEMNAVAVAEKLRVSIADDPRLKSLGVTVSLGVCSSEVSTAQDSETFIKHTDEAAYVAKRGGGNRVEVYK